MDILKQFDAYALRARLVPAVLAGAPAVAALALLISWKSLDLSNGVATVAVIALFYAIADATRERGRANEKVLYPGRKGMPSVVLFRRNDRIIDPGTKDEFRALLAKKLGVPSPSAEDEAADQEAADAFYEQCGVWLRENTRDTKKFPLVFSENVTYGFRRNLLGVKWIGLAVNVVVVAICCALLWRMSWSIETPDAKRIAVVLVVAAIHAAYMLLAVRRGAVLDAAHAYGRQLILSCMAFATAPPKRPRKAAVPKDRS
jgi:hypothetical protein